MCLFYEACCKKSSRRSSCAPPLSPEPYVLLPARANPRPALPRQSGGGTGGGGGAVHLSGGRHVSRPAGRGYGEPPRMRGGAGGEQAARRHMDVMSIEKNGKI